MPISALLITLRSTTGDPGAALRALSREPEVELGAPIGLRVPAVCETSTLEQGRHLVERLSSLEVVAHVDVLSVHFEDV